MPMRRKKWTEEEEQTLIDKYASMVADGSLPKLKTREKKFRPIAGHVNSVHHQRDPVAFPFQWTWKDASTKVQNMRHQYLLVKQKIKKPAIAGDCGGVDEFDWNDGLSHWPNFLRYKEVFGDVELGPTDLVGSRRLGGGATRIGGGLGCPVDGGFGGVGFENGVLGFEYEGEDGDGDEGFEYEEAVPTLLSRKKRRRLEKHDSLSAFLSSQLAELRQLEARLESLDAERDRERQQQREYRAEVEEVREKEREEREQAREKARRDWAHEWELRAEEERQRREEEAAKECEWEDRMDRRRAEWKKRMDEMMNQHRDSMVQIHSGIVHEQQAVVNQLLGIVSQWTGQSPGLSDHTGGPYLSQMMQNLHHVNGIVHGENRVGGDNHDDQFIVDG